MGDSCDEDTTETSETDDASCEGSLPINEMHDMTDALLSGLTPDKDISVSGFYTDNMCSEENVAENKLSEPIYSPEEPKPIDKGPICEEPDYSSEKCENSNDLAEWQKIIIDAQTPRIGPANDQSIPYRVLEEERDRLFENIKAIPFPGPAGSVLKAYGQTLEKKAEIENSIRSNSPPAQRTTRIVP